MVGLPLPNDERVEAKSFSFKFKHRNTGNGCVNTGTTITLPFSAESQHLARVLAENAKEFCDIAGCYAEYDLQK